MFKRTVVSFGALCLVLGGVSLLGTAPAGADTASCIDYLDQQGSQTTTRNQVCETTEAIGDTYSVEAALAYCRLAMSLTLLPENQTEGACQKAVAP